MTRSLYSSLLLAATCAATCVPVSAATLYALTSNARLVRFESGAPGILTNDVSITGIATGDRLAGIDFRPANGQLYGVTVGSRVYTINPLSGNATQVGANTFTPAASGTVFGVDFNPVPDRLRFVSNTGQNLRLQPDTGAVAATDTNIAYAAGDANSGTTPALAEVAYTNSFSGATLTSLFAIDTANSSLVRVGSPDGTPVSPNSGMLTTVGKLGPGIVSSALGFDISRFGQAFAAFQPMSANSSSLYTIDLTTGAATSLGAIGSNLIVTGLAISENTGPAGDCNLTGTPTVTGIVNAASFTPAASPNGLVTVFYSGFTGVTTAAAGASTFFAGRFPTELSCISVEFGGVRAPLTYAGPNQVNAQIPVNTPAGQTTTRLILNPGRPNEIRGTVLNGPTVQAYAPALFTLNGQSVAAQSAAFNLIADPAVIPTGRFARAGDVVILYGTGFGLTTPVYQSGELPDAPAATSLPVTVSLGGITLAPAPADVIYAGVSPGSVSGLYQINIRIPANAPAGNLPVIVRINGQATQDNVTIPVQ